MFAKVPVLDPDSPRQAKELMGVAYEISESFKTPVMVRPTTRVCHSRQDISLGAIPKNKREVKFEKNPARWAATPKFRLQLHKELEEKLAAIADYRPTAPKKLNPKARSKSRLSLRASPPRTQRIF